MIEPDWPILLREALVLAVRLAAPAVVAATVVGLVVAVIQTATQVQEQTIGLAARILAICAVLLLLGDWMVAELLDWSGHVLLLMAEGPR